MDEEERVPLAELARGFRKRTFKTVRLLSKVGVRMAKKNFGITDVAARVDEDEAVAAAESLVAQLDGLKGLAMKIGQMMSYVDVSLPPKARRVLARLQWSSQPMEPDVIAEVIRAELGGAPAEVFDEFEPMPFAAASIGQVHRARCGARRLAVKVQYPGIDELMRKDLATIGRLGRVAMALGPFDGKGIVRELSERVAAECDYVAEAESQMRLREALADYPGVSIPRVFAELSSRRVLTSEYVDRLDFGRFCDTADQRAKDRAAARIYGSCFQTIFNHCTYNADPHPGNYLFTPEGEVTLLDFGCVKRFDPEMIAVWKRLARSILDGDLERFSEALREAGFVGRARKFDYAHQLEAMRELYRPMLSDEPFTFTADWVATLPDVLGFKNKNKFKMAMAPDWLFINRLQFGLFSVLVHLGATGRWGDLFRAALDAPIEPLAAAAAHSC
jgi:predicted unusual protein kinase regulating ubiquinone biosynthesis (AarF/ABC1/UbiB family)